MSFLTPPPPVPEEKIIRAERADVVVVGEGLSGLCTALSAREQGLDVLIVTASRGPVGRGEGASFLPDQRKWYALQNNSEAAMDWLTDILRAAGLDIVLEDGNRGDRDTPTWMPPCTHAFVGKGVTRAGVGITLAVKALE